MTGHTRHTTENGGRLTGHDAATDGDAMRWLLRAGIGIAVLMLAGGLFAGVAVADGPDDVDLDDLGGSGEKDDPYVITNVSELQAMAGNLSAHYKLGNDIDASDTENWNDGDGFEPIGDSDDEFIGTFDGQGNEIAGLFIDRESDDVFEDIGLFGNTDDSLIKKVGLISFNVSGDSRVGGLVGSNKGDVESSFATGNVSGDSIVGGLVGFNSGDVSESYTTGNVSGNSAVGGLVGVISQGKVTKSYATGSVEGAGDSVGGLVGYTFESEVSESYATGNVDGDGDSVGGLVGWNDEDSDVSKSYATGSVEGDGDEVGGLVGYNNQGEVSESYATGNVDGDGDSVGGLVGYNIGEISESYATGSVDGDSRVGGLVGYNNQGQVSESYAIGNVTGEGQVGGLVGHNSGEISQSYWDDQAATITEDGEEVFNQSDGGQALRTVQMTGDDAEDDMTGFDFDDTWDVVDDPDDGNLVSYPFFSHSEQDPAPGLRSRYAAGDGDDDPYEIETWEHLSNVRENPDADFELAGDLDESTDGYDDIASATANDGKGFDPIGEKDSAFTGTFDGNQSVIQDLVIDRKDEQFVGLFGYGTGDVRLENVRLVDAEVHGNEHVGALAGRYREGVIENSSVQANVTAEKQRVGGMVGQPIDAELTNQLVARGTVTGGSASGTDVGVGGLVGRTSGDTSISVAYTQSTVTAGNNAGGIMGSSSGNPSTFERMYSASTVNGEDAGAVVGIIEDDGDEFIDSVYYDAELAGDAGWFGEQAETPQTADAVGLTTARIQGTVAAENMNELDFEETWATTGGYPIFQWEAGIGETTLELLAGEVTAPGEREVEVGVTALDRGVTVAGEDVAVAATGGVEGISVAEDVTTDDNGLATFYITAPDRGTFDIKFQLESDETVNTTATVNSIYDGGLGSVDDPYEIASWDSMDAIRVNTEANFTMTDHLDESTPGYEALVSGPTDGFEPIGDPDGEFTGSFNGNGFTVSDLTIDRGGEDDVGLFGRTGGDATIEKVGLEDVAVTGDSRVGGLVGRNDGTVNESYAEGDVTGDSRVGGLVGWNDEGDVSESYATGSVDGDDQLGGLIGLNEGEVTDSYATGSVDGDSRVGGLVGKDRGEVRASYWDKGTTNQADAIGDGSATANTLVGFGDTDDEDPAADMTGVNAVSNMTALAFTGTWHVTDSYPALAWQDTHTAFEVNVADTNEPVTAGETLAVTVTVTNWGAAGTDTVRLVDTGFADTERDAVDVDLDAGSFNDSVILEWDTSDAGEAAITVESSTDADSRVVVVDPRRRSSSSSGTSGSADETEARVIESDADADGQSPDIAVSVSNPEPGQTVVIENGEVSVLEAGADDDTDDTDDADGSTDGTGPDDEVGETDDSDDGTPTSNVRPDRLSVEIDTDRDFQLSITTYEADLTRSVAGDQRRPTPAVQPVASGASMPASHQLRVRKHAELASDEIRVAADAFETDTVSVAAGYVEITHDLEPDEISGSTFEFSIRESYLDELSVDPSDVLFYHRIDDGWEPRETDHLGSDDTHHRFEGTMPDFSVFALGTGAATVETTGLELGESTIASGQTTTAIATVENRGRLEASRTVELTLDGEPLATETVSIDGGETETVAFTVGPNTTGQYSLAVDDAAAVTLTVDEKRSDATDQTDDEQRSDATDQTDDEQTALILVVGFLVSSVLIVLGVMYRRRQDRSETTPPA